MDLSPEEIALIDKIRLQKKLDEQQAQEKAEELERELQFQIRQVGNYSDAEKIEAFHRLHAFAAHLYANRRTNQRNKDKEHYCFEAIMELLAHKGQNRQFWDHYNNLGRLLGNEDFT